MTTEEQFAIHQAEVDRWRADLGDEILRLCYPLNEDAVVVDAGGYLGDWAKEIHDRYNCNIHIFEPVEKFYAAIRYRLNRRTSIHVHQAALGATTGSVNMNVSNDGSGITTDGDLIVDQISITEWLKDVPNVDLLKLNVEGSEFEIIETLIATGDIAKIDNLQVQFHWFVEDGYERMLAISQKLLNTHDCTYAYDFVWENWKRKTN